MDYPAAFDVGATSKRCIIMDNFKRVIIQRCLQRIQRFTHSIILNNFLYIYIKK